MRRHSPLRTAALGALLALLALVVPPPASAQADEAPKADPRIEKALNELKLPHRTDEDGDFVVTLQLDDGRTHACYILSGTNKFDVVELREVIGIVYTFKGPIEGELAQRLLEDANQRLIGGWQIEKDGETSYLSFTAAIPADLEKEKLYAILSLVAATADHWEKELTKKDEY